MDQHVSTLIPESPQQSYPSPGSVQQMIRKKQVFVDVREVGPVSQAQARYVAESNALQSHLNLLHLHRWFLISYIVTFVQGVAHSPAEVGDYCKPGQLHEA